MAMTPGGMPRMMQGKGKPALKGKKKGLEVVIEIGKPKKGGKKRGK